MEGTTTTIMTLAELMTSVGTTITSLLSWLPNVFSTALQSPVVVAFIVLAIIGVVIRFAKRLMHV